MTFFLFAGLLASCQLTNLLLYQLVQQRQQAAANPFLSLANANLQGLGSNLNLNIANAAVPAAGLINPFPAINQNLIFPAETLRTYTTTTTYVTKLTTTAVITIPLLFGNKPVPTTITRTKTYDVTTSEVQTLTSTVKPTYVTQVITPTPVSQSPEATSSPSLNDVDEEAQSLVSASVSPNKKYQNSKVAPVEYEYEEPITSPRESTTSLSSKLSKSTSRISNNSGKRRKPGRSSPSQKSSSNSRTSNRDYQDQGNSRYGSTSRDRDDYYETDYQPYAGTAGTAATKKGTTTNSGFSKRKFGNIYEDDVAVDEDPAAAQYPDDYSYYTRRLKRGEQHGDEGEYQLEPSTDGDFSSNYQKYERCPPIPKAVEAQTVTVTRTETRTVTKFLGQSTLASNINLNSASRANYESPKPSRKRNRSRNRTAASADQSAAYTAPVPTTESRTVPRGTTEDSRAQILLRSRSRYNSNTNTNNNNNNYQANYDYYRG